MKVLSFVWYLHTIVNEKIRKPKFAKLRFNRLNKSTRNLTHFWSIKIKLSSKVLKIRPTHTIYHIGEGGGLMYRTKNTLKCKEYGVFFNSTMNFYKFFKAARSKWVQ